MEVVDTEVVCLRRLICMFAEDVVAMSMGERGTGFQLLLVLHPNFRVWTVFGCNGELEVCNMLICLVCQCRLRTLKICSLVVGPHFYIARLGVMTL